jgi:hypothetical protein
MKNGPAIKPTRFEVFAGINARQGETCDSQP